MKKETIVLVADADENVRDTTSTLLELFGCNVIQAKDGIDAINKFKKYKPEMVFLDIKMPKLDGYETFFEIEKQFPNAKIVFMTAHADYSKWREAKSKHALELIEKPYSAEKLRELLEKYCPK